MSYDLIEKEFSFLADRIYLNCSSMGVIPLRTRSIVNEYFDAYYLNQGRGLDDFFHNTYVNGKNEIGRLLHVSPENVSFFKSTTDAIINASYSLPLVEGDEIILTNEEHPANVIPWLSLAKQKKLSVKFVESRDRAVKTADLIAAIGDKTKVVAVSSTYYCTGTTLDLKALGKACRAKDVWFFVDAIQSCGRLAIYPEDYGIDFLACGGYKSLMGLKGIAIGYSSDHFKKEMIPFTGSNQSVSGCGRPTKYRCYDDLPFNKDGSVFENGNHNYMGILSLCSSVGLINEIGIENIQARVLELEKRFRDNLKGLPLRFMDSPEGGYSGVVVAFPDETVDYDAFGKEVKKTNLKMAVRDAAFRAGISFYNTEAQIDQAAEIIRTALDKARIK